MGLLDVEGEKKVDPARNGLLDTVTYDTALSPEDEAKFQAWAKEHGKDPALESEDYDLRGFWKSGGAFSDNGHGTDTFKKPNHPTFSDESVYSTPDQPGGRWVQRGDAWEFRASPVNLEHYSADELRAYFREREPDSTLVLPEKAK